jgi:DNA-binding CsgD family transcriptional regulator
VNTSDNSLASQEPASQGKSAIGLLREIQAGKTAGVNLAAADRRRIVEHLTAEGYGTQEVAEILKVADRTIQRDRAAIREQNAIKADPALVPIIVGNMMAQAEASASRLRRIARDKETPPSSRVEAESAAWHVTRTCIETLQELGYLPKAPKQVFGQMITTTVDGNMDLLVELKQSREELERLRGITRDPDTLASVNLSLEQVGQQLALVAAKQVIGNVVAVSIASEAVDLDLDESGFSGDNNLGGDAHG